MTAETDDSCAQCLFWKMARPGEGVCQRRAPDPAYDADRVAHWPTTHGVQGCGEFLRQGSAYDLVDCAACRFWRRPALGITPVDRADKPLSWWARAGHCQRKAPEPQSDPGPRAFWRACHESDGCAEGLAPAHHG